MGIIQYSCFSSTQLKRFLPQNRMYNRLFGLLNIFSSLWTDFPEPMPSVLAELNFQTLETGIFHEAVPPIH
uniref:Uncharacterized protein n=1 Tax=Arundo donax TaxID=35708 RepID=A0A0A9FLZ0_ARUDO